MQTVHYCYEHKRKRRLVLGSVKKGIGTVLFREACPVCDKLKHYKFICEKCKSENDYWMQPGCYSYRCHYCKDSGVLPEDFSGLRTNKIPSWRLAVDDADSMDILKGTARDFGMPSQTHEKWMDHYENTDYERNKMREFNKNKQKLIKEVLG